MRKVNKTSVFEAFVWKRKNVNKYIMIIIIKVVEHCKPNTVDSVYDLT